MPSIINKLKDLGPASLIAAAFIGPGTVTLCSIAGASQGVDLLWALLFATFATIFLQEMAARLGVVTKQGLGEVLRLKFPSGMRYFMVSSIVIIAIVVGNAAYEAGNIAGAVLGMEYFGQSISDYGPIIIGLIAFILLWIGNYQIIERILIALVLLLSAAFIITAIYVFPGWAKVFSGLFSPSINGENILLVIGLMGTTIVPYNLFLHAALVNEKWDNPTLSSVRMDILVSIGIGGLVSMAIMVCAAAIQGSTITNAADLAAGLKPILGNSSVFAVSLGLFAAGITSSITAPLAAAYAARGILGWDNDLKSNKFRMVWIAILIIGVIFSMLDFKPIHIIKAAQIANGILLPVIAIFLLWMANDKSLMKKDANKIWSNIAGGLVVVVTLLISGRIIYNFIS